MVDVAGKSTRGSDQIEAITTRLSIAVPDLSTGFAKDAGSAGSNPAGHAIRKRGLSNWARERGLGWGASTSQSILCGRSPAEGRLLLG
jgi:hypothetical protein